MGEESSKELVKYHREGHLGFITLNRPGKRNALNWALWLSLEQAILEAEADKEARVVVLKGEGKTFCAGLDLGPENELLQAIGATPSATQKMDFYRLVRRGQDIFTRLERLHQPTIAAIHGHCLGAGLELVLCCAMRFCSAETLFGNAGSFFIRCWTFSSLYSPAAWEPPPLGSLKARLTSAERAPTPALLPAFVKM